MDTQELLHEMNRADFDVGTPAEKAQILIAYITRRESIDAAERGRKAAEESRSMAKSSLRISRMALAISLLSFSWAVYSEFKGSCSLDTSALNSENGHHSPLKE